MIKVGDCREYNGERKRVFCPPTFAGESTYGQQLYYTITNQTPEGIAFGLFQRFEKSKPPL